MSNKDGQMDRHADKRTHTFMCIYIYMVYINVNEYIKA